MDDDELLLAHYSRVEEGKRLRQTPNGVLERIRTWDLLERWLPPQGVAYDIGGAAGVHATWLTDRGYAVELFDPVPDHVGQASELAHADGPVPRFGVEVSDARNIPRGDESADVILLLGPLYHLVESTERTRALLEAHRLLKPGGHLVAAGISRFSWLMDAYRQDLHDNAAIQTSIAYSLQTGSSNADPTPGAFWAYFHRPHELTDEIASSGFNNVSTVGVEGFAWMLPNLATILGTSTTTNALLDQLRAIENESSIVGASAHLLSHARKPT